MTQPLNGAVLRSAFVTGLASTLIALAGLATLIAVLQISMPILMLPADGIGVVAIPGGSHFMPPFAGSMFEHFRFFSVSLLLLNAATLISAIGLLKQKNWAQFIFIGIMGLGIVWNLASIAMLFLIFSSLPPIPSHGADSHDDFEPVWAIFTVVMGLAFGVLFGWIIKTLISHDIRRTFLAL